METMTAERLLSNVIGGEERGSASGSTMPVIEPATGELIADVPLSNPADLDPAVEAAQTAQADWAHIPLKDRVQVFYRMKTSVEEEKEHLAEVLTRENGKTLAESAGEIARAVECLEFAASLPQTAVGDILEVSRGVECKTTRHPLGVVAGITPFNFPFMVPLWMIPMAIALGNAFILKPSPLTPLSAMEIARLLKQAGLPDGVFSIVHGDKTIVEAICDHTGISALGFVGSTHVAKLVFERGVQAGKRARSEERRVGKECRSRWSPYH